MQQPVAAGRHPPKVACNENQVRPEALASGRIESGSRLRSTGKVSFCTFTTCKYGLYYYGDVTRQLFATKDFQAKTFGSKQQLPNM